ncbi:hypothetical protein C8Q78DRAFT_161821 [Trametes maxima]|nr:hypothetical protein C8Q78DRAFT_161821 [Trametes maxima]
MTETRTSRANTPRARAAQRTSQAARRASSVPPVGSKKPQYVLDCVLMTPRKRKRTTSSSHEDLPSAGGSRLAQSNATQKKLPSRAARTRTRSAEEVPSFSHSSSQSRKRASSSTPAPNKPPQRRAASTSRAASVARTEPSSSQRRRTASRTFPAQGKSASSSRATGTSAASRRNKGKARALPADFETSSQIAAADDSPDAASSTSGARRATKRRRVSPQLPLDAGEYRAGDIGMEDDVDSQETGVGEDFQMLDMPDDVSLPWVPIDPGSNDSAYVPPGLNALIEDMKRALVLQMSARQKAETLHAEELHRRRELEHEAARLAAANRALEAEREAWTASAAEALASTLESALVADMSRRRAAETPTEATSGAFLEEVPDTDMTVGAEARVLGVGNGAFAKTVLTGVRAGEGRARDVIPAETASMGSVGSVAAMQS